MHSAPNMYSSGSRPGHRVSGTWSKVPNLNENGQNLIFCKVFLAPNPVTILSRSATACSQANYIRGLPKYVDQFTISISHNKDVTKLEHHTGLSQAEKLQPESACD